MLHNLLSSNNTVINLKIKFPLLHGDRSFEIPYICNSQIEIS